MTTYAYTAFDAQGKKKSGFVEANDSDHAISLMAAEGRFVVEIKEADEKPASRSEHGHGRVNRSDIALFTRRMADLAAAGLPLDRVLAIVAEQSESARLADIAHEALKDVRGGLSVSEALAKHNKVFNDVFTQTLRAGEASGQFAEVAGRLADFQQKEVTRRSEIISAMIYPAILASTAAGVVIFLITFVMPRLSGVFKDLGNDLPITTKMLLGATDVITNNWIVIVGGIVAAVVLVRAYTATPAGAIARDKLLMNLPMVGPVVSKAVVSRFARVLGTLVYGGVNILEALDIAGMAAGNALFRQSSKQVVSDVREGAAIAGAMRDSGAFPTVLVHMVAIGEETGDLPKMLGRVSESLDFEVDNGMKRLTALVEPAIVLLMAVFVGFVVISVALPIFQAQDLVK
ncbi:MAG: type II secretion system F family protein [Armatimonadetes bacterium]|nr:type II secretion system F family protein [Armatimonadota bacterium]